MLDGDKWMEKNEVGKEVGVFGVGGICICDRVGKKRPGWGPLGGSVG